LNKKTNYCERFIQNARGRQSHILTCGVTARRLAAVGLSQPDTLENSVGADQAIVRPSGSFSPRPVHMHCRIRNVCFFLIMID